MKHIMTVFLDPVDLSATKEARAPDYSLCSP
jgi:hypothetical protein